MSYLDMIPVLILIVDSDVRILNYNCSIADVFNFSDESTLSLRGGDAINCLNAHGSPDGCGTSPACKKCVIRMSVGKALSNIPVKQEHTIMFVLADGKRTEFNLMVTASPIIYEGLKCALLILEDVRELVMLRQLIPLCSSCKKVRRDDNYWENVDEYLRQRMNLDFSHGICPDCMKELYPGLTSE